jgi:hypothetical protein
MGAVQAGWNMHKPIGTLWVVPGDQLSPRIAAPDDLDPRQDVVLMADVTGECR